MKVAIGFPTRATHTKGKPAQIKQVLERLLQPDLYDLFWWDGSDTPEGQNLPLEYAAKNRGVFALEGNLKGGPDRAFVHGVSRMLSHPKKYDCVGWVECDVLLDSDWFPRCMSLFDNSEGLSVGAVSARAYDDRVLLQRDGYACMHNLGWGHVIFTREAAELTLKHYRTGWTSENRKVFAQLCTRDIATQWCWRGSEQWICSDWGNDAVLAQNGLVSLALTPSACEMINQDPPLEKQGLRVVKRSCDMLRDDRHFAKLVSTTQRIRNGEITCHGRPLFFYLNDGGFLYFAHQLGALADVLWHGPWETEWQLGFGPFNARATGPECSLQVQLCGPCEILVGGGDNGGSCLIQDLASGFEIEPNTWPREEGKPAFMNVVIPSTVSYRTIRISNFKPGMILYGIKTKEIQMVDPHWTFRIDQLPPVILPVAGPWTPGPGGVMDINSDVAD